MSRWPVGAGRRGSDRRGRDAAAAGPDGDAERLGAAAGRDFRGCVRFVRAFGRPTRLEPEEQVWLVCAGVDLTVRIVLNGQPLGTLTGSREPARFDVTEMLPRAERTGDRSRVAAARLCRRAKPAPDRAGLAGGLIGEVRLEIFPPAGGPLRRAGRRVGPTQNTNPTRSEGSSSCGSPSLARGAVGESLAAVGLRCCHATIAVGQAGKAVPLGFGRGPIAQLGERRGSDRADAGQFGSARSGPNRRASERAIAELVTVIQSIAPPASSFAPRRRLPARRRSSRPRPGRPRRRRPATARPAPRDRGWRGPADIAGRRPAAPGPRPAIRPETRAAPDRPADGSGPGPRRCRGRWRPACAGQGRRSSPVGQQPIEKRLHAIGAGKDQPVVIATGARSRGPAATSRRAGQFRSRGRRAPWLPILPAARQRIA